MQSSSSAFFQRLFRTDTLGACALATLVFLLVPMQVTDPDIWWHLRNAHFLITTHHQITRDMYSYTAAGAPWMNHEWLGELPFYLAWMRAGATGLYVLTLVLAEAILLSVFALALRRSRALAASLIAACIAACFSTVSFAPRTLLFGWLLLVVELAILHAAERRIRMLWALPPLFALWVNTHGSWSIGLVLLAIWILANSVRIRVGNINTTGWLRSHLPTAISVLSLSVASLFVNPYGWRLVAYPMNLAFRQKLNVGHVAEWQPLDFHSPRGVLFLLSVAALALWQLFRQVEWTGSDLAFLAIGIYSGISYSRFLFLLAILGAPVAAFAFRRTEGSTKQPAAVRPLIWMATVFFLVCLAVGRLRTAAPVESASKAAFPQEALSYLAAHPLRGRLLNEYTWGGYLIWKVPEVPVFIDPRADIFEWNGTFKDYLDITHLTGTLDLLDRYKICYVLFAPGTPLVYLLEHAGGWKVDWQSKNAILLERRQP